MDNQSEMDLADSVEEIVWTEPAHVRGTRSGYGEWLKLTARIVGLSLLGGALALLATKLIAPQWEVVSEGGRAVVGTFVAVVLVCIACAAITRLGRRAAGAPVVRVSGERIVLTSSDAKRVFRLDRIDRVLLDARDPEQTMMIVQSGRKSWCVRVDPEVDVNAIARLLGSRSEVLKQ